MDFTIDATLDSFDSAAQTTFSAGIARLLPDVETSNVRLQIRAGSLVVTAIISVNNAELATDTAALLGEMTVTDLSRAVGQTVVSVSAPVVETTDVVGQGQAITVQGNDGIFEQGTWLTVVIVLVAFNLTTCLCCALKRNSWTMASSRRDVATYVKGLPSDIMACFHILIPCLLTPTMWCAWLTLCCKGAMGAGFMHTRAKIFPEDFGDGELSEDSEPEPEPVVEPQAAAKIRWKKTGRVFSLIASKLAHGKEAKVSPRAGATLEDDDDAAGLDPEWEEPFPREEHYVTVNTKVGKDGRVKERRNEVFPTAELFDIIDAMPMRMREMREDLDTD